MIAVPFAFFFYKTIYFGKKSAQHSYMRLELLRFVITLGVDLYILYNCPILWAIE